MLPQDEIALRLMEEQDAEKRLTAEVSAAREAAKKIGTPKR